MTQDSFSADYFTEQKITTKPTLSTTTVKAKMLAIIAEIAQHDQAYYQQAKPTISDATYDALYRQLVELEEAYPELIQSHSPTQSLTTQNHPKTDNGFAVMVHQTAMLSIDDYFSMAEIEKFTQRVSKLLRQDASYSLEPKIDGVAINLIYIQGKLSHAVTRGDGNQGEDVLVNIQTIANIPPVLYNLPKALHPFCEIRGEIFISYSDFEQLNKQRQQDGNSLFVNPRNTAAGSIKLLDIKEAKNRKLSFVAHSMPAQQAIIIGEYEKDWRNFLQQQGMPFIDVFFDQITLPNIAEHINSIDQQRTTFNYPTDGVVIKVSSCQQRIKLGATQRAPRWAAAYKFTAEKGITQVQAITVQVGRSGVLTPVAELTPILLSGSTISRATLHNQDQITEKDIRLGDWVSIEKSGEIIPAVNEVILAKRQHHNPPYDMLIALNHRCPACQQTIAAEKNSVALRCINLQCPAQKVAALKHFSARPALDIDGLGDAVANKIVEKQYITELLDIFQLPVEIWQNLLLDPAVNKSGIASKPRQFGKKRANKLIASLEAAKTKPLYRWLYAFGIPYLGLATCQNITKYFTDLATIKQSTFLAKYVTYYLLTEKKKQLSAAEKLQLKELKQQLANYPITKELGPVAAHALWQFLQNPTTDSMRQQMQVLNINPQSDNFQQKATVTKAFATKANRIWVITGTFSQPRKELRDQLIAHGDKVTTSISNQTTHLLCGDKAGSKKATALSRNIPLVSEEELTVYLSAIN